MKRRLAIASTLGFGALAGVNRLLTRRAGPLRPPLGLDAGTYRWRGMDIAYTEGGNPERPDVLLLHEIHRAGSSREFARIFDELAEEYHVIAPDLPGFGRSDRPPIDYSNELYEAFVTEFVDELTHDPAIVASSFTSVYAIAAAESASVSKLLLLCPRSRPVARSNRFIGRLHRLPLIGTSATNVRTTSRAIQRTFANTRLISPGTLAAKDLTYFWQTAHQPGARFAIGSMLAGDLDIGWDLDDRIESVDTPVTLLWGRNVTTPPLSRARVLAERADAKLVVIDRSRTWPHYEQAESFLPLLHEELATVPGR